MSDLQLEHGTLVQPYDLILSRCEFVAENNYHVETTQGSFESDGSSMDVSLEFFWISEDNYFKKLASLHEEHTGFRRNGLIGSVEFWQKTLKDVYNKNIYTMSCGTTTVTTLLTSGKKNMISIFTSKLVCKKKTFICHCLTYWIEASSIWNQDWLRSKVIRRNYVVSFLAFYETKNGI